MRKLNVLTTGILTGILAAAFVVSGAQMRNPVNVSAAAVSFGNAAQSLEAGSYQVSVALKKADDTTADSMAGAALVSDAILTVGENGSAEIELQWQTLTVFGVSSDVLAIEVYQEDSHGDGVEKKAVNVISTRTGVNGTEVPDRVSFTLPDNSTDGVYVSVDSGRAQDAYIAIDYKTAEALKTSPSGLNSVNLAAGYYEVPVALMNASDIGKASMAAAALSDTAVLTVKEDGTATLQIQWKPLDIQGLTGNASDIKIYTEQNTTSETIAASDDGNSKTSFDILDHSWDGVYVSMYVDAMQSNVDAYIAIDYASAVEKQPSLKVSKKTYSIKKGKKATISAEVFPEAKVVYTVKNKKIATVSSKGVIKAKKKGVTYVTVKCNGLSQKIKVTVK